jgi:hypothetical protein
MLCRTFLQEPRFLALDNPQQVKGAADAAFSLHQSTPIQVKGDAMHGIKRVADAASKSTTKLSLRTCLTYPSLVAIC